MLWGVVVLAPQPKAAAVELPTLPLGGGLRLQLSLVTLLTAWCCSELIRYSFFAFKVRPPGGPPAVAPTALAALPPYT